MLDRVLIEEPDNAAALTERAIIEDKRGNETSARAFAIRARTSIKRDRRRRQWMNSALSAELARLSRARTASSE